MKSVGLFEAKTRLSELCSEVARGQQSEILITNRGVPYVKLVSLETKSSQTLRERISAYREQHPEDPLSDEKDFELPKRSRDRRNPPFPEKT